ncbi:uncharacterized protein N7506_008990 [Penicillium brevicompactum]|uniref:uncharacterized protein n=1 Tax=Penicillium brevicompactum TaxID=5074 RepID=UPI002541708C|nr:uncharacterized protein N7506_008990 [Penicillium brevicompactum]KAJ5325888.1 hypothetical protein N7506_008990 [Penicillium brevicompactum]
MMVCLVMGETSELDVVAAGETFWDSLAGSIVATIGSMTRVQITCRPNMTSVCTSTPVPYPKEMTFGSDMQVWSLQTGQIGVPTQGWDLISAAFSCNVPLTTEGARCALTRVVFWSTGSETWTSTFITTTSYSQPDVLKAKLLITAGLEKLQISSQATVVDTTSTIPVGSLASTATLSPMSVTSITGDDNSNAHQDSPITSLESVSVSTSPSIPSPTTTPSPARSKRWSTNKTITISVAAGAAFCVILAMAFWHFKKKGLRDSGSNGTSSLSTIVPAPGGPETQSPVGLESPSELPAGGDASIRPELASSDSSSSGGTTERSPLVKMSAEDYLAAAREALRSEQMSRVVELPANRIQLSTIDEEVLLSSRELAPVELPVDGHQLVHELE